jgi:hypothetical protein
MVSVPKWTSRKSLLKADLDCGAREDYNGPRERGHTREPMHTTAPTCARSRARFAHAINACKTDEFSLIMAFVVIDIVR